MCTLVVGAPEESVGKLAFCCVFEGRAPLIVQANKSSAPLQHQLDGVDGVEDRPLKLRRRLAALSCLPLQPLLLSCLSIVRSLLA
jgi:hypothetical protein